MPHGADLQHHDADRVRDDVVELARDACALLRDGDALRRVALALGLRGAHLGGLGLLRTLAQRVAAEPADREEQRDEEELAAVWVGSW